MSSPVPTRSTGREAWARGGTCATPTATSSSCAGTEAVKSPVAPWALRGESVAGLVSGGRRALAQLPWGLESLPGPCLVAGLCYSDSPVGPYLELAVGQPARLGMRPG